MNLKKEHIIHCDLGPNDKYYHYSNVISPQPLQGEQISFDCYFSDWLGDVEYLLGGHARRGKSHSLRRFTVLSQPSGAPPVHFITWVCCIIQGFASDSDTRRTTVLGGSPRYFAELKKLDIVPRKFLTL